MAMRGGPTSRLQRPMSRGIAITMLVVIIIAVIGVATWIATRPANAPAAPVAIGTPTAAVQPVRHRTIVLAPIYTASTKIEQGVFSFHLHKVGHNGLAGTLNYSSPASPNGYSNRVGLASVDPITGTIIGRRVILDASSTPFHFDGTLSADQLAGTFAITDVGTTRGTYTFCPTADIRKATC